MPDSMKVYRRGRSRAAAVRRLGGIANVIIDIDGTMTDGLLPINANGFKIFKNFGADDSDAIRTAISYGLIVELVTADHSSSAIVASRAEVIGVPVSFEHGRDRMLAYQHRMDLRRTVYIGDGWYDGDNFTMAGFGIATMNALPMTKAKADAVSSRRGGDKAVAQSIAFILERLTK